jgi:ABC transport system ATP-binding/permease protein
LQYTETGWVYRDLGSSNGSFLHGQRINVANLELPARLRLGDGADGPEISIEPLLAEPRSTPSLPAPTLPGATPPLTTPPLTTPTLPATTPSPLPPPDPDLGRATGVFDAQSAVLVIGRSPECDVVLSDDLLVSRRHAELRPQADGSMMLLDLGSHNGTFVNGRRVEQGRVAGGDVVTIGHHSFRLHGGALVDYADSSQVAFAAIGLSVELNSGLVLLDDVSFALEGAKLLGVVGPSGSGKSTLLGALTGVRPAGRGHVIYGGRDVYAEYDSVRRRIGFVPQDDLVQPELTIRQSLEYAARLRFPPDVSAADRRARVDEVMAELGLEHRADVVVAKLSGGQRKRVSVALELLTKPSLLVLDEPTSGLDPGFERSVMELLRQLAHEGRTVIVVTHSVDSLHLCDRVLCLAPGGKTAYFGPPQEAPAFFGHEDYQQLFQDFSARDANEFKRQFAASAEYERFVAMPLRAQRPAATEAVEHHPPRAKSWTRQFTTLTARYAHTVRADRTALIGTLVAGLAFGMMMVLRAPTDTFHVPPDGQFRLFSRAQLPLFLITTGINQLGVNIAVHEIVKELAIFRRERAIGMSISAYLASKIVVLGVIAVIQTTTVVLLATSRQGGPDEGVVLGSGRLELIVVFTLTWLASMALGLLVSALVSSPQRVALILPAVLGIQVMAASGSALSGVPKVPVLDQIGYATSARWGFTAAASTVRLNDLQAFNNVVLNLPAVDSRDPAGAIAELSAGLNATSQEPTGDPEFNHETGAWVRAVLVLVAITAACLIGAGLALRRYDPL